MPPNQSAVPIGMIKFIGGVVITASLSFVAFLVATATALSGFPLSGPNFWFASLCSLLWGVIGGFIVGNVARLVAKKGRTTRWIFGMGSILWAVISGFCFFVFVAASAAC
jgi:hypothetical protein